MKRMLVILAAGLLALTASGLEIGDPAPTLGGVAKWLNGKGVDPSVPDGKTVYVVEFWATWCAPCRQSVPHLDALQEQYRDRDVTVVGITIEPEQTVQPFVDEMKMRYLVGLDTDQTTAKTYMKDVEGIPHAFIVDRKGKIAWAGHPLGGLDEALAQVVAGTFDPDAAKALRQKQDALMEALQQGEFDKALGMIDEIIAAHPKDLEFQQMKAGLLMQKDDLAGLKKQYGEMLKTFNDDAEGLNTLAWMLVSPSPVPLHFRDPQVAWAAASRAADLTDRKDPAILDTLALAYYQAGLVQQAIDTEQVAIDLADEADMKAAFQQTLGYYREALALQQRLNGQAPLSEAPASLPKPEEGE